MVIYGYHRLFEISNRKDNDDKTNLAQKGGNKRYKQNWLFSCFSVCVFLFLALVVVGHR